MADSKGYYSLLGVSEKASYHEIKRSYRRLARKYHPDRNNSVFAEEMIKKINAAFEVLSDETKRAQYDRMQFDNEPITATAADSAHQSGEQQQKQRHHHHTSKDVTSSSRRVDQRQEQYQGEEIGEEQKEAATFAEFFNELYSLDTPKGRFHIIVEPSLCLAFGSCEILAPKVFVVEKHKRVNPKARVECETCAEFDKIYAAAQTCPTKAIKIVDRYTGEQIFP